MPVDMSPLHSQTPEPADTRRMVSYWEAILRTDLPGICLELAHCNGKTLPPALRLAFADECPRTNGDNCLLTRSSAYVDLAFSRLLA